MDKTIILNSDTYGDLMACLYKLKSLATERDGRESNETFVINEIICVIKENTSDNLNSEKTIMKESIGNRSLSLDSFNSDDRLDGMTVRTFDLDKYRSIEVMDMDVPKKKARGLLEPLSPKPVSRKFHGFKPPKIALVESKASIEENDGVQDDHKPQFDMVGFLTTQKESVLKIKLLDKYLSMNSDNLRARRLKVFYMVGGHKRMLNFFPVSTEIENGFLVAISERPLPELLLEVFIELKH